MAAYSVNSEILPILVMGWRLQEEGESLAESHQRFRRHPLRTCSPDHGGQSRIHIITDCLLGDQERGREVQLHIVLALQVSRDAGRLQL